VPYPFATADHQRFNAEAFAAGGAAIVLADRDLTEETLRAALRDALAPARLRALREAVAALGSRAPHEAIVARVKSWPLAKTGAP